MRLDHAEALRRLNSPVNLANTFGSGASHKSTNKSNRQGVHNVPEALRDVMGSLALTGTNQNSLADAFGVSPSVVSTAKTGRVGGKPPNEVRRERIADKRDEIKDYALTQLMKTLGLVKQEDLEELKPKELTQVGVNMAKIVQSMNDPTANTVNIGGAQQVIFYSPELRDESKFKVVEI